MWCNGSVADLFPHVVYHWAFWGNAFLVCVCLCVCLCIRDLLLGRWSNQAQILYTRTLDPRDVNKEKKIRNFSKLWFLWLFE